MSSFSFNVCNTEGAQRLEFVLRRLFVQFWCRMLSKALLSSSQLVPISNCHNGSIRPNRLEEVLLESPLVHKLRTICNNRQGDSQFHLSETLKAHFYFTYFWLASILTVLKEEAIKLDFITDRSTYLQCGIKTLLGLKKWHKRSVSVNEPQQTSWALFRL